MEGGRNSDEGEEAGEGEEEVSWEGDEQRQTRCC